MYVMTACLEDTSQPYLCHNSTSTALLRSSQYYLPRSLSYRSFFYFDDILFRSRSDFGHSGWKIFRLTVARVLVRLKDVGQGYTVLIAAYVS